MFLSFADSILVRSTVMKLQQNTKLAGWLFMLKRSTSLGLVIILLAHSAVLLAAGSRPPKLNSAAPVLQPFGLTITVNSSGDADALNPNTDCDTDAGTPGEQCTLRAAIQRANAVAGED